MQVRSVSPSPARPSTSTPRACPTASKAFSEHVGAKTRAATNAHTVSSSSPSSTSGATSSAGANDAPSTSSSSSASPDGDSSSIQSSLAQSEDQNMQFLQIQSEVNDQSETFTTMSNVMKTENDTLKNTSANMAI
jgi:hypothetical protein